MMLRTAYKGIRSLVSANFSGGAVRSRFFWSLIVCFVVVFVFWDSPLLQPLKWLTVLFHELSHAIVGWLTGGRVHSLNITEREAGICRVAGGNRTLILMAGYPGSLFWGLGALFLARRRRSLKSCLFALGTVILFVTLIYIRPLLGFGFLFGLATAACFVALGQYGTLTAQRFSVLLVGVCSCVYVIVDIQEDVFRAGDGVSDAVLLAQHTGVPAWIWGGIWYILSLALIGGVLRMNLRRNTVH